MKVARHFDVNWLLTSWLVHGMCVNRLTSSHLEKVFYLVPLFIRFMLWGLIINCLFLGFSQKKGSTQVLMPTCMSYCLNVEFCLSIVNSGEDLWEWKVIPIWCQDVLGQWCPIHLYLIAFDAVWTWWMSHSHCISWIVWNGIFFCIFFSLLIQA